VATEYFSYYWMFLLDRCWFEWCIILVQSVYCRGAINSVGNSAKAFHSWWVVMCKQWIVTLWLSIQTLLADHVMCYTWWSPCVLVALLPLVEQFRAAASLKEVERHKDGWCRVHQLRGRGHNRQNLKEKYFFILNPVFWFIFGSGNG